VPAGSQVEEAVQPATATQPAVVAQPEEAAQPAVVAQPAAVAKPAEGVQLIRVGSGCLACPGERRFSDAEGAS
jgi:hypothetical protein